MNPSPAYWELRLKWESGPRWWRLWRKSRWRRCHESIARLEYDLGICRDAHGKPRFFDPPWVDRSYYI